MIKLVKRMNKYLLILFPFIASAQQPDVLSLGAGHSKRDGLQQTIKNIPSQTGWL